MKKKTNSSTEHYKHSSEHEAYGSETVIVWFRFANWMGYFVATEILLNFLMKSRHEDICAYGTTETKGYEKERESNSHSENMESSECWTNQLKPLKHSQNTSYTRRYDLLYRDEMRLLFFLELMVLLQLSHHYNFYLFFYFIFFFIFSLVWFWRQPENANPHSTYSSSFYAIVAICTFRYSLLNLINYQPDSMMCSFSR